VGANNPFKTRNALQKAASSFENLQFGVFLSNHDQNRVMNRFLMNRDKARLAAAVLLTAPGVPYLYYGEEIGMSGAKPDENIRTPFHWSSEANAGFTMAATPWRLVNTEYVELNVTVWMGRGSLLSYYRDLIYLRNQHAALRWTIWSRVEQPMCWLSVSRRNILVVLNFNEEAVEGLT
jgi:glycosidase